MSFDRKVFDRLSDEELCAQQGSESSGAEEELVRRYGRLVRACARPLFLAGGDSEDLIQEGMMGLLKAIRSYNPEKAASFRTYAEICIRSKLATAVRAAQRDKHLPLNHSISFETPLFDGTSEFLFPSEESPEDVVIGREELQERTDALKGQLSGFEAEILSCYLGGLSCAEIADRVNRPCKSVDNAIQRIRRKMLAQKLSVGGSSES